jgi:hypothetical protein
LCHEKAIQPTEYSIDNTDRSFTYVRNLDFASKRAEDQVLKSVEHQRELKELGQV